MHGDNNHDTSGSGHTNQNSFGQTPWSQRNGVRLKSQRGKRSNKKRKLSGSQAALSPSVNRNKNYRKYKSTNKKKKIQAKPPLWATTAVGNAEEQKAENVDGKKSDKPKPLIQPAKGLLSSSLLNNAMNNSMENNWKSQFTLGQTSSIDDKWDRISHKTL